MKKTQFFTGLGRVLIAIAVLALLGAWLASRVEGGMVLGMTEQHLFNDTISLALLGIAFLLDGMVHRQTAE